jgi:hypothetical protein
MTDPVIGKCADPGCMEPAVGILLIEHWHNKKGVAREIRLLLCLEHYRLLDLEDYDNVSRVRLVHPKGAPRT